MKIQVRTAQKWLIGEWFVLGGLLALVLFLQCLLGHYGDKRQDALNWFGATIAPTLTLMLGGFAAKVAQETARKKAARKPPAGDVVEGFPFFFAFGVCLVYLVACFAVVLLSPLAVTPPLDTLRASEQWLHLIQAASGATLGWFFVSKQQSGGG